MFSHKLRENEKRGAGQNNGAILAAVIESASVSSAQVARAYLSQSSPDTEGLAARLKQLESFSITIPLDFDATSRLFIVGVDLCGHLAD